MKKFIILVAFLLAISITPSAHAEETQAPSARLTTDSSIEHQKSDIRVVALENIFKKYNSPLVTQAQTYVKYADKYNVDWKLLPAISGLESSFGVYLLPETHNAYGWGGGYIYFKDWEDGIDTINKSLREDYMDKWKAKNVWEIGPIYAESPTWSVRVDNFMNEINDEYIALMTKDLKPTFNFSL